MVLTPVGIGPYGGVQGTDFSIDISTDPPLILQEITIYSSGNFANAHINGITFTYISAEGQKKTIEAALGNSRGVPNTVHVARDHDNYLTKVAGKHDDNSIKSLTFITSDGSRHGPFGDSSPGNTFEIRAKNCAIVGFFGNSGPVLNALGAYVTPLRKT